MQFKMSSSNRTNLNVAPADITKGSRDTDRRGCVEACPAAERPYLGDTMFLEVLALSYPLVGYHSSAIRLPLLERVTFG